MQRKVIGLNGLPGSGKDSVADYLVSEYGFLKIAFADALKVELCRAFDVPLSLFNDREHKTIDTPILAVRECGDMEFFTWFTRRMTSEFKDADRVKQEVFMPRSPRWLMQQWGTEFRQSQKRTYWVDKVTSVMNKHEDKPVVLSDVRFAHEVRLVDVVHQGEIWSVVRPNNPYKEFSQHSSNAPFPDHWIDRMLVNDGDLDDLYQKIKKFVKIT